MPRVPFNCSVLHLKWLNFSKSQPLCTINFQSYRHSSSEVGSEVKNETVVNIVSFENEEDNILEKEAILESKRNKSRLNEEHRNIIMNSVPFQKPMCVAHKTVKFNRKMFGKYGQLSGVNPGISWPTKEELVELKEYESIAYPFTIQEMVQKAEDQIKQENEAIKERQEKIMHQLLKMQQWKTDIENRAAKKLALATAAKEKKERLIEEVRRHFGYKIDPRDDRFKEMLAQKEKAEKKKVKEARIKAREEEYMSKILEKHTETKEKA